MSNIGGAVKSSLARSGMLGQTKQISALQDRQSDVAYKTGLSAFSKMLQNAVIRSYNSGAIGKTSQASPQTTAPSAPTTATTTAPTTASMKLAQGVSVVQQEPIILKYNKIDYGLDDQGKWSSLKNPTKKLSQNLQAFLSKQHDISLGINNSNVSESYQHFNELLESIILNEAQGISSFITNFINGQAKKDKFIIPASMKQTLNTLSKSLETDFLNSGGKQLNPNIVRKLWDVYYTSGQYAGQGSNQDDQQEPGTAKQTATAAANAASPEGQQRTEWKNLLAKKLEATDINDPASLDELKSITSSLIEYLKQASKK